MNGMKAYTAEFLGTFVLCFIGAGSICADALTGGKLGLVGIALAHGLALSVGITALGHVSGGHFNPAVTFGFLITGRLPAARAAGYVVAQLLGAFVGGLLVVAAFSPEVRALVGSGVPVPGEGVSATKALWIEAVLTFLLVLAVWGTAVDARAPRIGGFGIGLTVAFDILMGGPLTGASMNPARTFGPALAAGVWTSHWVYWVGPLLGGGAAALLYHGLFLRAED
jgi:MIP family channel proteins